MHDVPVLVDRFIDQLTGKTIALSVIAQEHHHREWKSSLRTRVGCRFKRDGGNPANLAQVDFDLFELFAERPADTGFLRPQRSASRVVTDAVGQIGGITRVGAVGVIRWMAQCIGAPQRQVFRQTGSGVQQGDQQQHCVSHGDYPVRGVAGVPKTSPVTAVDGSDEATPAL